MTVRYKIQSPPVPGTETMTNPVAAAAGTTAGLGDGGTRTAAGLASTRRTARPRSMG